MGKEQLDTLKAELSELGKKYKIKGISFCGYEDDNFIGLINIGARQSEFFDAVLSIGRLWQASRESIRNALAEFET